MTTRRVEFPLSRAAEVILFAVMLTGLSLTVPTGCAGGSSSMSPTSPTMEAPTVSVAPASTTTLSAQPLQVVVTVSSTGGNYPTPTGSVILSSGSYSSTAVVLAAGAASFTIPASSLAVGSDSLTATYSPGGTAASDFIAATGTATVTISSGATPNSVTASSVTYPTMGAPFEALARPNGTVLVGVPSGIQVFTPPTGQVVGPLTATCVDTLPSSLTAQFAAVSELSLLPNGFGLAAGLNTAGAGFYNLASLEPAQRRRQ